MASREIHGIKWKDDLAWMEPMRGERWNSFIRKEQENYAVQVDGVKEHIPLFMAELNAAKQIASAPLFQAAGVELSAGGTNAMAWRFKGESAELKEASDICTRRGGYVWTIEEVGKGAEVYSIRLWKKGKARAIWQHTKVAPQIAVVGDRCYCLKAKNRLVYYKLVSWDAYTGKDEQVHYEEKDYRYNLELIRGDDSHAHLRRQAGGKQDGFVILPKGLKLLEAYSLEPQRFVFGSQAAEYLYWSKPTGWQASPSLKVRGWRLPSFKNSVPETLDTGRGLLVTKWHGCRTLWRISKNQSPFTLFQGWAQLLIDHWDGPYVRITQGSETSWWNSEGNDRPNIYGRPLECKYAKSRDGSIVAYVIQRPSDSSAKGLLVVGYGAYGLPTPLGMSRWQPLLNRGWAVAIGLWRGGGDHTPEWEDAGRVHGRLEVLDDAEAVVRAARKLTGVPARKTVLYGRSAGGLWVGGLVTKFPGGSLAGGAYMEVPYLDALRTITNRDLPLTNIETDEFGLPSQRLSDFRSALEWSPMEQIPEGGVKGLWQIVRTGLNDSEVFAYESAKWVARSGSNAFLAVEGDQGHFVSGALGLRQQASDLAVILDLVDAK